MLSKFGIAAKEHAKKHYLGVKEVPMGSNHGPEIDQWGYRCIGVRGGFSWCACFVWNMFAETNHVVKPNKPALVVSWVQLAYDKKWNVTRPFKGDVVAFSWEGPTAFPSDHIGFVDKVLALPWPRNGKRFFLKTVEGNVDEGVVRTKWRWVDPATVVFIRVQ